MGQSPTWGRLWGRAHSVMVFRGYAMGQSPTWGRLWGRAPRRRGYGADPALWGRPSAMGQLQHYRADPLLWVPPFAVGQMQCYGADPAL